MVSEINRSRSDLSGCWGCGASSEIPSPRRTASVSSYGLHRSYCLLCFEREVRWLVANVNGAVHASSSARLSIKRRTSRLESRIHSIRWLLLPFPKLQLRFLSDQALSSRFFQQKRGTSITEKSATFAFFFFVLFGMVADQEQVGLDHFPHQRSATTPHYDRTMHSIVPVLNILVRRLSNELDYRDYSHTTRNCGRSTHDTPRFI